MHSRGEVVDGIVFVARDPRATALTGRSHEDGAWYASAAFDVDASSRAAPPAPHVVILYDISSSSVQQDTRLIRDFLRGFLAQQQAWGTAEVIPFHTDVEAARRIDGSGTSAGFRDLERTLDALQPLLFDTDWSWVDLHVTEPSGERVSWDHDVSGAGATFTGGYTYGFGPEIYRIANAPLGDYRLEIDYYADDVTTVGAEALTHVVVYRRRRRGIERSEFFLVLSEETERRPLTTVPLE
jgi:hypothetical protein